MSKIRIKFCGLRTAKDMEIAAKVGAAYVGMVFYPKSPRHLDLDTAREIAIGAPAGLCKVALVVDADDAMLDRLTARVPIDMLQLHGTESPARVSEIRARYGLPVMKAVGIACRDDLPALLDYSLVADQILVDAKPDPATPMPGGNGLAFDWNLIAHRRWLRPWMLAGGLRVDNVAAAIRLTGATQVDVSSGIESRPGIKDPALMAAFAKAAMAAGDVPSL